MPEHKKYEAFELNEQERQLIEYVRKLNYGEMNIMVREGKPVRIEEIKKSIMLTKNESVE